LGRIAPGVAELLAVSWKRRILIAALGVGTVAGMTLGALVDGAYVLPTEAMLPSLRPGDRVLVRDVHGAVRRGEVVVATPPAPEHNLDHLNALLVDLPAEVAQEIAARQPRGTFKQVARVVAVGGDRVEVRDGGLYVNGEAADEPYLAPGTASRMREPVDVPPGHVYLLGDNRADSRDSTAYGPLPLADIESVVTFRYWPPRRLGGI
jgi:signal peptidase I